MAVSSRPFTVRVGQRATGVRLLGGFLTLLLAGTAAWLLAAYSQAAVDVSPQELESVMVASFEPPETEQDFSIHAIRAVASLASLNPAAPRVMELELQAQLSAEFVDPEMDGHVVVSFVLGGVLADAVQSCDDSKMDALAFDDLSPAQQSSVVAGIRSQLIHQQKLKNLSPEEFTGLEIRRRAHQMHFVVVSRSISDSASWAQEMPDELRSLPIDSNESPPPVEQTFTGREGSTVCEIGSGLVHHEIWGPRLEVPSLGLAAPFEWRTHVPRAEAEAQTASGIAVESETTVSLSLAASEMDMFYIAEGTSSQQTLASESERSDTVQVKAIVDAQSRSMLDTPGELTSPTSAPSDVLSLNADRFSMRFTNEIFRATREIALFSSGALVGLAATMIIAISKTIVRAAMNFPKSD